MASPPVYVLTDPVLDTAAKAAASAHRRGQVVKPFADRGERARPSQHDADPDRRDRDETMTCPAARSGIGHRGQGGQQIDLRRIPTSRRPPGPGSESSYRRRYTGGHATRSGDRAGVGTVMSTSGAVSAPHLPHHRRATRRHAVTHGFAGALGCHRIDDG